MYYWLPFLSCTCRSTEPWWKKLGIWVTNVLCQIHTPSLWNMIMYLHCTGWVQMISRFLEDGLMLGYAAQGGNVQDESIAQANFTFPSNLSTTTFSSRFSMPETMNGANANGLAKIFYPLHRLHACVCSTYIFFLLRHAMLTLYWFIMWYMSHIFIIQLSMVDPGKWREFLVISVGKRFFVGCRRDVKQFEEMLH